MVDVPQSQTINFQCSSEDALERKYAADFAKQGGCPGEYYVLKDQNERQTPGPVNDPFYGEPIIPVRPEETDVSVEQWLFRDPILIYMVITSFEVERTPGAAGSITTKTMMIGVPADADGKIPCDVTQPHDLTTSLLLNPTTPKPGDVIWVGGDFNLFMDVDEMNPRGFRKPGGMPVWYELKLVRRSKYFPERKVILPDQVDLPNADKAERGTGFQNP